MRDSGVDQEKDVGTGKKTRKIPRRTLILGLFVGLFLVMIAGVQGMHAFTKDSSFCVSCHVMEPVYGTWSHSSHRDIAGCNDCHLDNSNYVTKSYTKATSGVQHLYHNTMGSIPVPIKINEKNTQLVQDNCLRCHQDVVRNMNMDPSRRCFDCHRYTPHSNYRQ